MPVIIPVPQDPTDLVIAGFQMRDRAFALPVQAMPAPPSALLMPDLSAALLLAGEQPAMGLMPGQAERVAGPISANAVICTPCGAVIDVPLGLHLMMPTAGSSQLWAIVGQTQDGSGVALGGCRVIVFEVGRLAVGEAAMVAEAMSDGGGNFTIPVPTNVGFQLTAYLPGAPDVAGIGLIYAVVSANG